MKLEGNTEFKIEYRYVGFMSSYKCPVCGGWHVVKHTYKNIPILECDKMDNDKMFFYDRWKNE